MRFRNLLLAAAASVAAGAAFASSARAEISANKKLVRDALDLLFVQHKVDEMVDTYLDPDFIQHDVQSPAGVEPVRSFFKEFFARNPDTTIEIGRILADGDLVAVHCLIKANPQDRGMAMVDIYRVKEGKIAEHWDVEQPVPETSANDNGMF
jgi:predicted SnoaL-like aldol condensation-catalyzing enzyme